MTDTHGEIMPPEIGGGATTRDVPGAADLPRDFGYRNLFGVPAPSEQYGGFQIGGALHKDATRQMLHHLAERMEGGFGWTTALPGARSRLDNPRIPSGYTYLAQLVAHDLSHLATLLPTGAGNAQRSMNVRRHSLVLDTIYGGGPFESPYSYERTADDVTLRTRFRLGYVRSSDGASTLNEARDIARAACPNLRDVRPAGLPEVLIADARNDNNLILAQLTTLFQLLHNAVLGALPAPDCGPLPQKRARADTQRFQQAKDFVTFLYWRVLRHDLLRKLLNDEVYQRYASRASMGDLADSYGMLATELPREFTHAVFRMGHAMVRHSYSISGDQPPLGATLSSLDAIRMTSSGARSRYQDLPLREQWVVQWSHFFDLANETGRVPNLSRRIQPGAVDSLLSQTILPSFDESDHSGIMYRDLLRGASVVVRSVASLIDKLRRSELLGSMMVGCQLLAEADFRAEAIASWLRQEASPLTDEEITCIAKDPPLGFFVLFEAAFVEQGKCLGPLGSAILAEVLFAALARSARDRAVAAAQPGIQELAEALCPEGIPENMPGLVKLTARLSPELLTGRCKFI